jgi:hypothetical protein
MVADCLFIKLLVGEKGTEVLVSYKINLLNGFAVGLAVLLKNLSGSAELAKVRQTLCRVGDSSNIPNGILLDVKNVLCAVYAFPSIGDINEVFLPSLFFS